LTLLVAIQQVCVPHIQEPEVLLLLICWFPNFVARWAIVAHQFALSTIIGDPATYLGRGTPDHLRVMTVNPAVRPCGTMLDRGAWDIIRLFGDPTRRSPPVWGGWPPEPTKAIKVLAIWHVRRVDPLMGRQQILGPSLCAGGKAVAPYERRNSNGSALAVNDLQDDEISIVTYL
jgi:hypothetical protein